MLRTASLLTVRWFSAIRHEPSHGVVAALVAPPLKLLIQDFRRAPILLGLLGVMLQLLGNPLRKTVHPRHGLDLAMIFKLGRVGPENLADRVPAQVEVLGDLPDRLLVSTMGQLDLAYCFHRQHLLVSLHGVQSNDLEGLAGDGQFSMPITARGGSLLHADSHIGAEHVKTEGDALVAGTRNAFGRAVNWIKSVGNSQTAQSNRQVVGNLVAQLRDVGVSNNTLDVAQKLLSAHSAPGKPISGRAMAQVTATVIRMASEEQAISSNLDINIAGLKEKLEQDFDAIFTGWAERFGMADIPLAPQDRQQLMDTLQTKCRQWGERNGMHAPGLSDAREMLSEACRRHCLAQLDGAMAAQLSVVGNHLTPDAPLCQRLHEAMQARGMDFEFNPADLNKLYKHMESRFEGEFKIKNTHPPTSEEAIAVADRVVNDFLNIISEVDNNAMLTVEQRTAARNAIIEFPSTINTAMVKSICECVGQVSHSIEQIASGPLPGQGTHSAISSLTEAIRAAVDRPGGDPNNPILRPGFGGADEVATVRDLSIRIGAKLAHIPEGQTPASVLARLVEPQSDFNALRFALTYGDPDNKRLSVERDGAYMLLNSLAKMAGLDSLASSLALQSPGVGQLSMAQIRAAIPANVHTVGWPGARQDVNLAQLGQKVTDGIVKSANTNDYGGVTIPGSSREFQAEYVDKFGTEFLKDFFRNGIEVDGRRYGATGTNNGDAMQRELRGLAEAFTSTEMAGKLTYSFHQGMGADVLTGILKDPALADIGMEIFSPGVKTVEENSISITTLPGGEYKVAYDFRLQYGCRTTGNEVSEARGINAHADIRINMSQPEISVQQDSYDIMLSQNEPGR